MRKKKQRQSTEIAQTEQGFAEPVYHPFIEETQEEIIAHEHPVTNNVEEAHDKFNLDDEIVSSIVNADFFGFENSLIKDGSAKEQKQESAAQEQAPEAQLRNPGKNRNLRLKNRKVTPVNDEPQTVAKYHDDNLPYSFLWWLDKTRKEHTNVYQPYAKAPVRCQTLSYHGRAEARTASRLCKPRPKKMC